MPNCEICIKRNLNEFIPWQIEKDNNENHGLADERWYYHFIVTENFLGYKYGWHLQWLQYEFGQNRSLQYKQNVPPWAVSPLSPGSTSTTASLIVIGSSTSITWNIIKRQTINQDQ